MGSSNNDKQPKPAQPVYQEWPPGTDEAGQKTKIIKNGGFYMLKVTAIFDNAGGMILKLGNKWAQYYDGKEIWRAAEDYKAYMQTGNTDDWDGHEPEALEFEPTQESIRNGGYKVMDQDDITEAIADPDFNTPWYNIAEFINYLKPRELSDRIKELLEKQVLTEEELNEVLESDEIEHWENCGNSGLHVGYIWYSVQAIDGNEYDLYSK